MEQTLVVRLRLCLEQNPSAIASAHGQAAVAVALTDEAEPHLLLIRRSLNLSLHPGEIALPGGKLEPTDANLAAAALREAWEEVALPPAEFQLLRLEFEPWRPADMLAGGKLLSFGLSTNWERELLRAEMARLTLVRHIVAIALTIWKKGETFDVEKLNWAI